MLNPETVMQQACNHINKWCINHQGPCYIGWLERNIYCCQVYAATSGFHFVMLISKFKVLEGLTNTEWNNLTQKLIEKYKEVYLS